MSEARIEMPQDRSALSGEGAIVAVEGEFDLAASARLAGTFDDVARIAVEGPSRVTLDISRLRSIDSAGIASLLQGIQKLHAAGADLVVHYPSPMVLQLLEICNFMQIVGIEFALSSLADSSTEPSTQVEPA